MKEKGFPKAEQHDIVIVFGDLNFRTSGLSYDEALQLVNSGNYLALASHDELVMIKADQSSGNNSTAFNTELQDILKERDTSRLLLALNEGELLFPPTYKFDKLSSRYDSSKQKRVASYCDRVLFLDNPDCLGLVEYRGMAKEKATFSDHKPVTAVFQVYTKQ
jgi:hypothetical protein